MAAANCPAGGILDNVKDAFISTPEPMSSGDAKPYIYRNYVPQCDMDIFTW